MAPPDCVAEAAWRWQQEWWWRVTQTAPHGPSAHHQKRISLRRRLAQLAWASVPVWSLSLLAFVPFLWLAVIRRRRRRDWVLFAAYAAVVVLELVLLSVTKARTVSGDLTIALLLLVMGVATIHTLAAFRPGSAVPSWRDAHAIRAASKLAVRSEKLAAGAAREDEIREKATAARAVLAAAGHERDASRAAARAASAASAAQQKQERKSERAAARAERKVARLASPRYGWVETRRTYRRKTIFGNRRSQTIVSRPSQPNARRRTRQIFGVTITEEWRRLDLAGGRAQPRVAGRPGLGARRRMQCTAGAGGGRTCGCPSASSRGS